MPSDENNTKLRPILVLGMHRSGTSFVTQLLAHCGVYLGEPEHMMPPDNEDNPEGYFENLRFVDLNERILAHLGGSWDAPPTVLPGWEKDPGLQPFYHEAEALLKEFEGKRFAVKDPRTALLLPFYAKIAPWQFLVVTRHPVKCARSLEKRGLLKRLLGQGLALWEIYCEQIVLHVGADGIYTDFERFKTVGIEELKRISTQLDEPLDPNLIESAAGIFRPELLRSHSDGSDSRFCTEKTLRIYAELLERSGSETENLEFCPQDEAWRKQLQSDADSYAILTKHYDAEVRKLIDANQALEKEIENIHLSLSWRITTPLRSIRGRLKG